MKGSELIAKLQSIIASHGDLPVYVSEPGPSASYDEFNVEHVKLGQMEYIDLDPS